MADMEGPNELSKQETQRAVESPLPDEVTSRGSPSAAGPRMKPLRLGLKVAGGLFLLPVLLISVATIYWDLRSPPSFDTDPILKLEHWVAVPAGDDPARQHASNTDMIHYQGFFFLIHAQTKWHLEDKRGALVVQRSADARKWEEVARITVPDTDVRDPKFAVIHGRLFLYFLPNLKFDPDPRTTYWSVSDDGITWRTPEELVTVTTRHTVDGQAKRATSGGWMLWRPKTRDGKTWYVIAFGRKPAYRNQITVLFKTQDGVNWEEVSEVFTAHGNGEPTMEFRPDGGIIATLRCSSLGTSGYLFGNPTGNTIIASSPPPYAEWSYAHSFITRLDGATLFALGKRIFAVGRNHMGPRIDLGNHFSPKRTAFYEVEKHQLVHLFDLPSTGDTAYTGVVVRGDDIYASYYTPPIAKEYPWIFAICYKTKTDIRIAKVSAAGLLEYATRVKRQARLEGRGLYRAGREQEE